MTGSNILSELPKFIKIRFRYFETFFYTCAIFVPNLVVFLCKIGSAVEVVAGVVAGAAAGPGTRSGEGLSPFLFFKFFLFNKYLKENVIWWLVPTKRLAPFYFGGSGVEVTVISISGALILLHGRYTSDTFSMMSSGNSMTSGTSISSEGNS